MRWILPSSGNLPAAFALAFALALASCQGSGQLHGQESDGGADVGSGSTGNGGSWVADAGGAGAISAGSGGVVGSNGGAGGVGGAISNGGGPGSGGAGGGPGSGGAGGAPASCPSVACAGTLVCERYDGPVCRDADWAEWPMPNSPIDVTDGAPNPSSYTDNGDGTVTDAVTNLMWQKVAPATVFSSFNAATQYCVDLVFAGHDDWRVPSRIELLSIVDYGRRNPSIDPVFGGDQLAGSYVTSTRTDASDWIVSFFEGGALPTGFSTTNIVRCVR